MSFKIDNFKLLHKWPLVLVYKYNYQWKLTSYCSFIIFHFTLISFISAGSLSIDCFPANVGNSWEYHRTFYVIDYDTVNNDTTEYLFQDSLYEEFEAIDTMSGWKCYRLQHILFEEGITYPETYWYSHPDTALLWIAYTHNYALKSSIVPEPNINIKIKDKSFNSIRSLARYLHYMRFGKIFLSMGDTIYWSPPKKLYTYPLVIGKYWVSMTDPWLEEREILSQDSVDVPAGIFHILKMEIKSSVLENTDSWYQWIGKEGRIKDSMHLRVGAYDSVGNLIGYSDVDDMYELVDYTFLTGIDENNYIFSSNIHSFSIHYNSFSSITRIQYFIVKPTLVTIDVYDIAGRLIKELVNKKNQSGSNTVKWDSKRFGSGIYFIRLSSNGLAVSKKIMIMK